MGSVMPKVKIYFFISIICLLINMTMLFSGIVAQASYSNNQGDFLLYEQEDIKLEDNPNDVNISATDFAFTTGMAFVPFFSLISVTDNVGVLPNEFTLFWALLTIIFGTFQGLLIGLIILNFAPKILGSGFDV